MTFRRKRGVTEANPEGSNGTVNESEGLGSPKKLSCSTTSGKPIEQEGSTTSKCFVNEANPANKLVYDSMEEAYELSVARNKTKKEITMGEGKNELNEQEHKEIIKGLLELRGLGLPHQNYLSR